MPAKAAAKASKTTKSAMSAEHKKALAIGREESRAVRRYLEAIEAHKPKRGRKRTSEGIEARLRQIEAKLPAADPLTRVHLMQERINLQNELANKEEAVDLAALEKDFVGDQAQFLQDGMKVLVQLHEGRPIGIKLPVQVTLEVVEADAVVRGGTAAPSYKGATLSNGMRLQVPPFIEAGANIVVSTEDGTYVRRAD